MRSGASGAPLARVTENRGSVASAQLAVDQTETSVARKARPVTAADRKIGVGGCRDAQGIERTRGRHVARSAARVARLEAGFVRMSNVGSPFGDACQRSGGCL
jgi:hypothetical protein